MYYYVNFQRPPPRSCPVNQSLTVAPLIANDLRTENYEEPLRIIYQWLPAGAPSSSTVGVAQQRPLPLTTWQGSMSSYKALSIPPPEQVRPGDAWTLALWVDSRDVCAEVTLGRLAAEGDVTVNGPIAVLSEPVRFVAASGTGGGAGGKGKAKGKAGSGAEGEKQDRIRRRMVLPPKRRRGTATMEIEEISQPEGDEEYDEKEEEDAEEENGHRVLVLTEQTSFDLDKKIWDSGLSLSAWLSEGLTSEAGLATVPVDSRFDGVRASMNLRARLARILQDDASARPLRVLELGTGIGLVSLALTSILPTTSGKHQFYATDLPSALPLIEHNLATNAGLFSHQAEIHARSLDWTEPLPDWLLEDSSTESSLSAPLDIVVMADVTYNVSIFPALLNTLLAILTSNASSSPSPLVLLAFKERDPTGAERDLWPMAAERGVVFERVAGVPGHGGEEVEIWIGGLAAR